MATRGTAHPEVSLERNRHGTELFRPARRGAAANVKGRPGGRLFTFVVMQLAYGKDARAAPAAKVPVQLAAVAVLP